jgi:hypothetical protein
LYKTTRELPAIDTLKVQLGHTDPRSGQYIVDRSRTVRGARVQGVLDAWRRIQSGVALGCYSPGYRVDFLNGQGLILHVEICFGCHHIVFGNWEDSEPFDPDGEAGIALRQALDHAMRDPRRGQQVRTGPN